MELDDLFEMVDIDRDEDIESNSVGGFIVEQLGELPMRGQKVNYQNLRFTVKRVRSRRIISALVELIQKQGKEE